MLATIVDTKRQFWRCRNYKVVTNFDAIRTLHKTEHLFYLNVDSNDLLKAIHTEKVFYYY